MHISRKLAAGLRASRTVEAFDEAIANRLGWSLGIAEPIGAAMTNVLLAMIPPIELALAQGARAPEDRDAEIVEAGLTPEPSDEELMHVFVDLGGSRFKPNAGPDGRRFLKGLIGDRLRPMVREMLEEWAQWGVFDVSLEIPKVYRSERQVVDTRMPWDHEED